MRRLSKVTVALVMVVAAIPGVAIAQDLRSPDARDSAHQVTGTGGSGILNGRDLVSPESSFVSPDASDSARPRPAAPAINLQSPDAASSAAGVSTYEQGRTSLPAQQPVVLPTSSGFDWGDAGIGAAGMLALIALGAGTLMIVMHRRREHRVPVATG
jgi:hypothetical protein